MKNSYYSFGFLILLCSYTFQGQWRSDLYPVNWTSPTSVNNFDTGAFLQDFSYAGYKRGEVSIPNVTTNIVDVTQAPYNADNTGSTDTTTAIQDAINQVGDDGGGVVFLPAGTYNISLNGDRALRIALDNVILRSAGTSQTFIHITTTTMNRKKIIEVSSLSGRTWDFRPTSHTKLTKDLLRPTMILPVSDTGLFTVGDDILLRSYPTDEWVAEHNENREKVSEIPIYYCRSAGNYQLYINSSLDLTSFRNLSGL